MLSHEYDIDLALFEIHTVGMMKTSICVINVYSFVVCVCRRRDRSGAFVQYRDV